MRVFVAGATGAVGRQLVPQLVARGHQVVGTTRSPAKQDLLRRLGAQPLVADGLDGAAVGEAVAHAEPEVIIHQMTALARARNLRNFDKAFTQTNRLRSAGTDHLLAAATAVGTVRRFIAQSYTGWTNVREGGPVKTEDDPLDPTPLRTQRLSMDAIAHLERAVLAATPVEGVVLRYGLLYGPGSSEAFDGLVRRRMLPLIGGGQGIASFLHVEDAASAAVAAIDHGPTGIYNIVDDEPAPTAEWLPYLAASLDARPPLRIPAWLGRLAAGEAVVSMMTDIRGSSNAKAKRELGWVPTWPSWREGFRHGLDSTAARAAREAG
jgi:2-alkyl-3-oxoalkanoate reductase